MSFSWTEFYNELFLRVVSDFDAKSLAKLAYDIFPEKGLMDKDDRGNTFRLEELEPCTFLARFNRAEKWESRIDYCKRAKERLKLKSPVPTDFDGIPTFNNQNSWLFPFKRDRKGDELKILWEFCRDLARSEIREVTFNKALTVKYAGSAYLTMVCYMVRPDRYLPLDGNTRRLVAERDSATAALFDLKGAKNPFAIYLGILEKAKSLFPGKSNKDISHQAWNEADNADDDDNEHSGYREEGINFWTIAPGEGAYLWEEWKSKSQISIGWDELGDLSKFPSHQQLEKHYIEHYSPEKTPMNNARACFEFASVLAPGDIVFAKKGRTTLLGVGEVQSDYVFEGGREDHKHVRRVKWLKTGEWKLPEESKMALKALTNISWYPDFVDQLASLVGLGGLRKQKAAVAHFFAYHKAHENGPMNFSERTTTSFWSRKPQTFLEKSIGNWVWVIEANKKDGQPIYDLVGIYSPEKLEKEDDAFSIEGKVIHSFNPAFRLNGYPWFQELFVSKSLYSHGFSSLGDELRDRFLELTKLGAAVGGSMARKNAGSDAKSELTHLNTIFYGPPGTGKTYKALQLQSSFTDSGVADKDRVVAWVQEQGWWEVVAAAMIDLARPVTVPELFDHEFIQLKTKQSSSKTPKNSIWAVLQAHTVHESKTVNYKSRQEPLVVDKDDDSKWSLVGDWKEQLDDIAKDVRSLRERKGDAVSKRFKVVTFHQSYSYEEFVEGIRPERNTDGSGVSYQVKDGVFKLICQRALENPDKEYALFIDEINRGNISKIFGELITLIEEDKRLGATNEITVTLPYSGQQFGVPRNLFIVGTMNSVDRSIALVDMALRRRFDFISIRPQSELIEPAVVGQVNVRSVFEKLNNKIAVILGSEYQIGHSYFMGGKASSVQSLKRAWFGSILPLLQEYLFDDWSKLKALVGEFVLEKPVAGLEQASLVRNTYGAFVESSISDEKFVELIKSLE